LFKLYHSNKLGVSVQKF